MRFRTLLLAAILVVGFVYVTTKPGGFLRGNSLATTWSGPQVAHSAGLTSDEQNNIDVYKSSRDAVVYITSTVIQRSFFFGVEQGRALGSGFVINPEGQIITNHHVISGSSDVEVTMPDQTTYKATILVRDPQDDLALIKITPKKKLSFLNLGDSDRLQVGQKVLAIGQPLGLQGTLTVGVVSTVGRSIEGENNQRLEGMIQTDAAINSGNSGGPLLDSQGNVVGINTAIYGPNGNIGIGFAMPINRVKNMLEDFRAGKRFGKPYFGASAVYIAGDLADALHLPNSGGLLIQEVHRGSPADEAGLRQYHDVVRVGNQRLGVGGDFITSIEGKAVSDVDSLVRAMSRKRPGDDLDLTIFRDGKSIRMKVRLGEAPDSPI